LRGRPDAQTLAFGPEPIDERDVKAVQIDAGMEAVLQALDDAGAQKWLGAAQGEFDDASRGDQCRQQANGNPLDTSVPGFSKLRHAASRLVSF